MNKIPEECTRDRLVAVLCFACEPNVVIDPDVQEMFWGRSSEDITES